MEYIINELEKNTAVFQSLLSGVDAKKYRWKSHPEKWCLLEIICHLYDEEREDFRARTHHILQNPELPFTSIDPVGWVKERKYMEQGYDQKLNDFLSERQQSVQWLRSLIDPKWDNFYEHPKAGKLTAKFFLANWLAHDYLHIRQIVKVKFDYLNEISGETLTYAGEW